MVEVVTRGRVVPESIGLVEIVELRGRIVRSRYSIVRC